MSNHYDRLYRFTFEHYAVRGELVRLNSSWRAVLQNHDYPASVADQLGQSLAAVSLMSATIKIKGKLTLQAQGNGPLHTLVAETTNAGAIRGIAHWQGNVPDTKLQEIFGEGNLVMTIDTEGTERYQGIISLQGDSLAHALEDYFQRSEQLPSRFWLFANDKFAGGLMLQMLPTELADEDSWHRFGLLVDTLSEEELFSLPADTLLHRLFSEDDVRLFEPSPISFRCACGRDRIASVIRAIGQAEAEAVIERESEIKVTCEFCHKKYTYDAVDIAALFETTSPYHAHTEH